MSDLAFSGLSARTTTRATDITGPDNLLLLLPNPGDEIAYATLVAELCARGRPPFVAILADGAPDGSHAVANARERASRAALHVLGMPDDRVLFVGLRQDRLPAEDEALFGTLKDAMALLSWRKDCNIIGAGFPGAEAGDRRATWQVADAIAREAALPLLVGAPRHALPGHPDQTLWDLDLTRWGPTCAAAALLHTPSPPEPSARFLRVA